jgi:hypothetical protein
MHRYEKMRWLAEGQLLRENMLVPGCSRATVSNVHDRERLFFASGVNPRNSDGEGELSIPRSYRLRPFSPLSWISGRTPDPAIRLPQQLFDVPVETVKFRELKLYPGH